MSDFDVIVVGAGYGGTTAAALLAKEGRRVLLIDKNDRPGGKAMTIHRRGYGYEMWPVLSVPADDSRFHELVRLLGIEDDAPLLVPEGDAVTLHYRRPDGEWRGYSGPSKQAEDPLALDNLEATFGVTADDVAKMAEMMGAVLATTEDQLDDLDDIGMLEWLRGFGLPEPIISHLSTMLNLIFVAPVDRIPVSEGIFTMQGLFAGGGGRYHLGGYGRVAEACVDYLVAHGGTWMPKTRVEEIIVEGGRAVGVRTAEGELRAPVVISNAGIQPTVLKLIKGEEHLPDEYVKRVIDLEPGWGMVGIRYFLDKPIFSTGMTVLFDDRSWWDTERYRAAERDEWPDVPLIFVAVPNIYDPSLAPDEHQVALVGLLGSADPKSPMNEQAIARAEQFMFEFWPELPEHIERREPYTALHVSNLTRDSVVPGAGGECIGLAQVIGQCGRTKPDARTPLDGLWLVGTDAGGRGCGTHQAVDSGFNVAASVNAELATRQGA